MSEKDQMKLGFIGAGNVAKKLAEAFLEKGYEIRLGSRSPEKLNVWVKAAGKKASAGTLSETAVFGDVLFFCVGGEVINEAIAAAGPQNFAGKTLIDVTNPMDFSKGIPPRFTVEFGNSLGEQIQRMLPDANVVKAFSSIGLEVMTNPYYGDQTATMLIAGNDKNAKNEAAKLAQEFGWDIEDIGEIDQSFLLEAFANLWVNYGLKHNTRSHAFKLLKR
ncbi:MAG: NAD(P)-binding domain-containing protein [Acidobacteria bacterium]|nr:NAD(P)-binding domain-containing protein [Acidobacteriota bacterium]